MRHSRHLHRIGPWRLLDIFRATWPWRASMLGGTAVLPEYGPPDYTPDSEHVSELPDSNIAVTEQAQAVARERSRRFMRARGT